MDKQNLYCYKLIFLLQVSDREFLLRVLYFEIYNEEVNDLLALDNKKLRVYEN